MPRFARKYEKKTKENKRGSLPFLPFLFALELLSLRKQLSFTAVLPPARVCSTTTEVETNDVLGEDDTA